MTKPDLPSIEPIHVSVQEGANAMSKKLIPLIALLFLLIGYAGYRAAGAQAHHAGTSGITPDVESAKEQAALMAVPDPTPSPTPASAPTLAPTPSPAPIPVPAPPPRRCLPDSMCWIQASESQDRATLGWIRGVRLAGRTLGRPVGAAGS